ncbi:MAG: hypothetical protein SGPRY_008229 [Prymnesium sp.]
MASHADFLVRKDSRWRGSYARILRLLPGEIRTLDPATCEPTNAWPVGSLVEIVETSRAQISLKFESRVCSWLSSIVCISLATVEERNALMGILKAHTKAQALDNIPRKKVSRVLKCEAPHVAPEQAELPLEDAEPDLTGNGAEVPLVGTESIASEDEELSLESHEVDALSPKHGIVVESAEGTPDAKVSFASTPASVMETPTSHANVISPWYKIDSGGVREDLPTSFDDSPWYTIGSGLVTENLPTNVESTPVRTSPMDPSSSDKSFDSWYAQKVKQRKLDLEEDKGKLRGRTIAVRAALFQSKPPETSNITRIDHEGIMSARAAKSAARDALFKKTAGTGDESNTPRRLVEIAPRQAVESARVALLKKTSGSSEECSTPRQYVDSATKQAVVSARVAILKKTTGSGEEESMPRRQLFDSASKQAVVTAASAARAQWKQREH